MVEAPPQLIGKNVAQLSIPGEIMVVSIGGHALSGESVIQLGDGTDDEESVSLICSELRKIAIIPDYSI